ncbi:hypothetical protein [Natronorubrum halophilum]|uniref:hypothetical protein n=1 Tax=Natronorubrum halophilum TaxID=1702106 RepID=UPI0010C20AAA|nr:hypothetical protein [Natronorubrum halophilum]
MADLTAFGLEPQEPADNNDHDESETDTEPVWSECADCEYVGYEVKCRLQYPIPLCTACFVEREGLL